mmetsp:Transcript_3685/g.7881  ORF Transcript_3685/g.7881 Transcript_3685/m.7881 type:complete len:201 (-) Transcript_3685:90-692(-)
MSFQPSAPMQVTEPTWPSSVCWHLAVRGSQSLIEWSRDPVKMICDPSGLALLAVRQWTEREWPSSVIVLCPARRSQMRAVRSTEPETSVSPWSMVARHMTAEACSSREALRSSWPIVCTFILPSSPPEMTCPLGRARMDCTKSCVPSQRSSFLAKCGRGAPHEGGHTLSILCAAVLALPASGNPMGWVFPLARAARLPAA